MALVTEKGSGERRGFVFVTYTSFEAVDKVTDKPFHKIGEKEVGWFGGGREGNFTGRNSDKGPSLSVGRSSCPNLWERGWFGGGRETFVSLQVETPLCRTLFNAAKLNLS